VSRGRVLIVDDEPEIRRVLRMALVSHGYEITEARSGEEALGKFREPVPEIVLLDLKLPGMGGLETCRAIMAVSDVPIIVLSARHAEKEKVELLDAGADDYLVKPFGVEELLARMRVALRRTPAARVQQPLLVIGDVEVDFKKRRVRRAGEYIGLKPKEFELLHYLIAHQGYIIPHRRLLQALWGPEYGNEFEYLRVIINRLRRKIEADPARPKYIITEPKVGYGFLVPEELKSKPTVAG
jgi:two-component system KDP operon response regulator KdpE